MALEKVYKSGEHQQLSKDKTGLPAPPSSDPGFKQSRLEFNKAQLLPRSLLTPVQSVMKTAILTFALATIAVAAPAPLVPRAPPNVPTTAAAKTALAGLTVAAQGPQTGYSRDLFPHWITQSGMKINEPLGKIILTTSGSCNTREVVLARDGTNVVQDSSSCAATSGTWKSPYDGATWTAASDVDIDHMVPLSNAWKVSTSTDHTFDEVSSILTNPVRRLLLDHSPPPVLRQRPYKPAAARCD